MPASKPDPARGWLYVQKLIDEEEADRVAKLSEEEWRAEFPDDGSAPEGEWSVEEIVGIAEGIAAKEAASTPPVTPEASRAALPEPAPQAKPMAPVGRVRKPAHVVWLLAAAFCFLVVIFKMNIGPDVVGQTPPPTNRDVAETDRDMAEAHCALKDWAACKERLDAAAKLDPEGESEPRVQKARAEIATAAAALEAGTRAP